MVIQELWPTLLNSLVFLLTIFCIAIVLPYSLENSVFDFTHLLIEMILVLVLIVVNVFLEIYEFKIKSLWHIKRCMSHSDNFMGQSPCPWESKSYPSQPITTLRSQVTVRGLRDHVLVNIPCTLLVNGDIIQLDQNTPSPAHVSVLNNPGKVLRVGEAPCSISSFKVTKIKCIEDDEFDWFKVIRTPIIDLLEKSVESSPPRPLLYQQKKLIYKIVTCLFVPIVFAISFVFSLARWIAFKDYFSWETSIFVTPIYSILLLLAPSVQIVWKMMNAYGIVVCDVNLKSSKPPPSGPYEKFVSSIHTSVKILKAIFSPYNYPLPEHMHGFGNLTAICAVDKEYLLTGGMPMPEKVFFFRSEKQNTSPESPELVITTPCTTDDDMSGIEFDIEQQSMKSELVDERPSYSIEITPEIVGLSKNSKHQTGLSFDDPKWPTHISSLKPIALNIFTTSHIPYLLPIHYHSVTSFGLQHYLYKSQCSCPLAYEIGVSEYPLRNFSHSQLLYLIGDQNQIDYHCVNTFPKTRSYTLMQKLWDDFVQPHFISTVIEDRSSKQSLLMSRGSADFVVSCCTDFWDGSDLQPLTETEKLAIMDFFAKKTLSAYCVALAYGPLSQQDLDQCSNKKNVGIYLPGNFQHFIQSAQYSDNKLSDVSPNSSNILKLISNQIFLGMVSLQYQPKEDIISLVQNLEQSGIRFIHYTAENEVRGKLFAEKLGLEAGWNCHISLSAAVDEKDDVHPEDELEDNISNSSDSSSSTLYYPTDCYSKAKLPRGIDKVRSHIEKVDNVPLLVPLFTDCSPDAVSEMIKIMQENGEVVMCMGNAWVRENISILAQANIGLSFIPSPEDIGNGDCAVINNTFARKSYYQDWPTPLEAAASLNSLTSGTFLSRDADINLLSVVQQCRHSLGSLQRGLLCFLALSLCVTLVFLLPNFFFQPHALSGAHLFWLMLFSIPILSLSILSIAMDKDIISRLPDRKNIVWNKEWKHHIIYYCIIYVPISCVCLTIYWYSLSDLCRSVEYFECNVFLGNVNESLRSLGWRDENMLGHLLAQNVTALFLTIYLAISTILFIHHSKPTWKVLNSLTWQYITFLLFVIVMQIVFFAVSQSVMRLVFPQHTSFVLGDLPYGVWIIGFLWIIPQVLLQEMIKLHNHKIFIETQRRLKLSFETKLGMHSPV